MLPSTNVMLEPETARFLVAPGKPCAEDGVANFFWNAVTPMEIAEGIDRCNRCTQLEACQRYTQLMLSSPDTPLQGVQAGRLHHHTDSVQFASKGLGKLVRERDCATCATTFTVPRTNRGQRFCSHGCRHKRDGG